VNAPTLRDAVLGLALESDRERLRAEQHLERLHEASAGDPEGQRRFLEQITSALGAPGPETDAFVRRFWTRLKAAHVRRMVAFQRRGEREDRVLQRLMAEMASTTRETRRRTLERRLQRAFAGGDAASLHAKEQQTLMRSELMAVLVFPALGPHVLACRDVTEEILGHRVFAHLAADVIEHDGPAARPYLPHLLRRLDEGDRGHPFREARALAAVARADASAVPAVVARVASAEPHVCVGALSTLYELGATAASGAPDAAFAVMGRTYDSDPDVRATAASALGRIARKSRPVVERLLDLTEDDVPSVRGAALTALGDMAQEPAIVVPRLIAALDDYVEENPDFQEWSDHQRIADALASYGAAASAAVGALQARIRRKEGGADQAVVQALSRIGPAALPALPALETLLDELPPDGDEREVLEEAIGTLRAAIGDLMRPDDAHEVS